MRSVIIVGLALALGATGTLLAVRQEFPHEAHERLFPLCEGCHLGIEAGDSSAFYPEPALCGRCHDGVDEDRVEWNGPTDTLTNLRFDHTAHTRAVADSGGLVCESCHAPAGAERMQVAHTVVANCLDCHAHQATEHLVDASCGTCHVPLASSGFPVERILDLPAPPDHERDDFLTMVHGELADVDVVSCSTCHTRERCSSCHVNASTVPAIVAMPAAAPALAMPSYAARYPTPASHRGAAWIENHGGEASVESCSTCHTRDSCETCHRASQPRIVGALPARRDGGGPGVVALTNRAPESHTSPDFARNHGTHAATTMSSCTTCHTRETCGACHERAAQSDAGESPAAAMRAPVADTLEGPQRTAGVTSRFHPATFMLRHSSSAYGRRLECANCHDVRVFCRDCHTQTGLSTAGGSGRLRSAFHDAEPLWLLRHARAARQGLESCTACHSQRDCLQCHSQLGAFRINPHGDGFDARRAAQRNAVICFACHVADPLGGREE